MKTKMIKTAKGATYNTFNVLIFSARFSNLCHFLLPLQKYKKRADKVKWKSDAMYDLQ